MDIKLHTEVIREVISTLNAHHGSNIHVLKGGTALMVCYALDRVSVDIDLDCESSSARTLFSQLSEFCVERNYQIRFAKDTDTVQRAFINYGDPGAPLKVEASYRRKAIPADEITSVNGIKVYTINALCQMKAAAFLARDKMRDLYDLTFIHLLHESSLDIASMKAIRNALEYKGLEQFDYLMATQDDDLIDKDLLMTRVLQSYEKVGLAAPK